MIFVAAALLASAAVTEQSGGLTGIFSAACLDGQVELSRGEAEPITMSALPRQLQRRFGTPVSGQIWRLNGAGRSYLYVLEYAAAKSSSPKVCGLASDSLSLGSATGLLGRRLNGVTNADLHQPVEGVDMIDAEDAYTGSAHRTGDFTFLEIKQMTQKQQLKALHALHQIDSDLPKHPRTAASPK